MIYAPTLTTPPAGEPLDLAEGQLYAGVDWTAGDPRDVLMLRWIAAARQVIEKRTQCAFLAQTWSQFFDTCGSVVRLPLRPVSWAVVYAWDATGGSSLVDPGTYRLDTASGVLVLNTGQAWPTNLRASAPFEVQFTAGWATPAAVLAAEPMLVHALGLLVAHYATTGRDIVQLGHIVADTPYGFDDALASYLPVVLA